MIEQAKVAYSPLEKALQKQTKTIEDQEENQIKAIEEYGRTQVESNELIKNDFTINRDGVLLRNFHLKVLLNLIV